MLDSIVQVYALIYRLFGVPVLSLDGKIIYLPLELYKETVAEVHARALYTNPIHGRGFMDLSYAFQDVETGKQFYVKIKPKLK